MNVNNLSFPVICIFKNNIFTSPSLDSLTTTTTAAISGGLFRGLKIIDSAGKEYKVKNISKLHGIGFLGGFNIFLNRTVRIDIDLEDDIKSLSLDEVRCLVLDDLRNWIGWESRGDLEQLTKSIAKAPTIDKMISCLNGA